MRIDQNSTHIVDIGSAVQMLSQHKYTILRDNGWVLDEYDDMFKNGMGRMLPRERMDQILDKYINGINEWNCTEIDIFKVLHTLLTELSKTF
jgi:hypothetical protein